MKVIPVASRESRRRARLAELVMEIGARAQHQASIDAIGDRTARARWHFLRRIHEQLRSLGDVPGVRFIAQLLTALVARLRREDALDRIEDADRVAIAKAAFEAAGLIEELTVVRAEA